MLGDAQRALVGLISPDPAPGPQVVGARQVGLGGTLDDLRRGVRLSGPRRCLIVLLGKSLDVLLARPELDDPLVDLLVLFLEVRILVPRALVEGQPLVLD